MLMIYDTGETVHYRVPAVELRLTQKWRDDVYNPFTLLHGTIMRILHTSDWHLGQPKLQ